MKLLLKAAAIAASVVGAQAAFAEVHEVEVLRYGYFPEKIYVQPGDQIKFINRSPNWVRVLSNNPYDNYSSYNYSDPCSYPSGYQYSEDGWATGWIAKNNSATITVTSCMENEIEAPSIYQYNYYDGYNEAYIVFGDAPSG